ncbi:unnamed protein product, partial [Discosporangium mesarthrocarpum]
MLKKIKADHDLAKAFHQLLFASSGKKNTRKKNISSFSGFPEEGGEVRDSKVKRLAESKKWTSPTLKDLCVLLCLEKTGDK